MTNAKQNNNLKIALKFLLKTVISSALVIAAQAGANMCGSGIAKTSVYFIPHVKDYCHSSSPCPSFKRQVRMQGSGILPGNKLLTYANKTIPMGDCDTAFGASGKCLIPYISVAADPRYYSMGDIIQMPSLKGKIMTLPDGRSFIHPGFLIVHDTGGAIKGVNRFDLFTGTMNMNNPTNSFGTQSTSSVMTDVSDCNQDKAFTVVRRGTDKNELNLAAITEALEQSTMSGPREVQVAMANSISGVR